MSFFQKALRKRAFIKFAVMGPSGSGKTFSALQIASGLVSSEGKIALLDTENESASLYADRFDFDTCPLAPPFHPERFIEIINAAVDGGYEVLVIDSISHEWIGEGGILAMKESRDARGGNSFTNWAEFTKRHEVFKTVLQQSKIHIIATMRSKQEYVVEQNGAKSTPKKVGLAAVQRDGFEYEFTTVLDIAMNHEAAASKDRTGLFVDRMEVLTPKHGKMLRDWLESGAVETSFTGALETETTEPVSDVPTSIPAKKSNPARDHFDTIAAEHGLHFANALERGREANLCLGRLQDCADPIDWSKAAEALPARIAEEKASKTAPQSQAQEEARQKVAALASTPTPSKPAPSVPPAQPVPPAATASPTSGIPQGRPKPVIHRNNAPEPKIPMRDNKPKIDDGFGSLDDFEDPFADTSTSAIARGM